MLLFHHHHRFLHLDPYRISYIFLLRCWGIIKKTENCGRLLTLFESLSSVEFIP